MTERDVVLTYETIWQWYLRFGQTYVKGLKCRRGKTGDKRHLDELFLEINGKTHYLWRAVGNVLDRREEEVWQGLKGDLLETQPLGDDNTVAVCDRETEGMDHFTTLLSVLSSDEIAIIMGSVHSSVGSITRTNQENLRKRREHTRGMDQLVAHLHPIDRVLPHQKKLTSSTTSTARAIQQHDSGRLPIAAE